MLGRRVRKLKRKGQAGVLSRISASIASAQVTKPGIVRRRNLDGAKVTAEEVTHRMIEEEVTEADPQRERREEEGMEEEEEEVKRKDGMIGEAQAAQRKEAIGMFTSYPPSKTSKARNSSRRHARRI